MYYPGDMMIHSASNVAEMIHHEAVYYAGDGYTMAVTKCMMVYYFGDLPDFLGRFLAVRPSCHWSACTGAPCSHRDLSSLS